MKLLGRRFAKPAKAEKLAWLGFWSDAKPSIRAVRTSSCPKRVSTAAIVNAPRTTSAVIPSASSGSSITFSLSPKSRAFLLAARRRSSTRKPSAKVMPSSVRKIRVGSPSTIWKKRPSATATMSSYTARSSSSPSSTRAMNSPAHSWSVRAVSVASGCSRLSRSLFRICSKNSRLTVSSSSVEISSALKSSSAIPSRRGFRSLAETEGCNAVGLMPLAARISSRSVSVHSGTEISTGAIDASRRGSTRCR